MVNDVLGLIDFKADIQDPNGKLVSWNEDDDSPCNWIGVKCNPRYNRVSELVLDGFALSGWIGKALLQLQFLRKLSLAKKSYWELKPWSCRLRLFSTLAAINFSSNQFSGSLPSGNWSLKGLRLLDLSNNHLDGEIPKGIEGLNNLRAINLQKNKFTGAVPDGIGSCLLLRSIAFSENSFSGSLPNPLQNLALCNDNSFSGWVPTSIGNLQSLRVLNISMNAFTGSFPESMINFQNLLTVDLSQNSLTGSLPSWILKLGVQEILLSGNRLSGSMDSIFSSSPVNSHPKLLVLDLSHNALLGKVPSAIGDFSSLRVLNLYRNSLKGGIPASIGDLKALDILDLSENRLNGSIPLEIEGAISLKELRPENNSLVGTIPTSIQKCSSLTSLANEKSLQRWLDHELEVMVNVHEVRYEYEKQSQVYVLSSKVF
ncbi:hypothetical protein U1Q18_034718 [Sarracenia purpurea var. burkii]